MNDSPIPLVRSGTPILERPAITGRQAAAGQVIGRPDILHVIGSCVPWCEADQSRYGNSCNLTTVPNKHTDRRKYTISSGVKISGQ